MPVYEYKCEKCGEKFEQYQSSCCGSTDKVKCPHCGSEHNKRIFSSFSSKTSGGSCGPSRHT